MSVKSSIPFNGTKEQEEKLLEVIKRNKNQEGALMPTLQEAQEIYGYLPLEVQKIISEGLDIPLSEIYGVATFYSQFTLVPKGKYKVSVCLGTACYVKGSGKILDEFSKALGIEVGSTSADGMFTLEATRCVGACGLAPIVTVNEDVYGKLETKDVADIVKKYK
jgi:NADH:ubiquinone oxidoreductase subunit E